ncbi:MAG TPA: signal peptidase I [Telmatospirillum sp.]|nr:signal peptidase I [Telmatospirillum sp.]
MTERHEPSRLLRLWRATATRDLLQMALIIGFVLTARTVIAAPYYVPSGSMEPTLRIGDELLATKYAYGFSRYSLPLDPGASFSGRWLGALPERGAVVVFHPPGKTDETWVKRVIGLPGDRVQMIGGHLHINGAELPLRPDGAGEIESQNGAKRPAARLIETLPNGVEHPILKLGWDGMLDNTPLFVVPAGHLFMMGDSRDNSLDSRVSPRVGGLGFVPVDHLLGRADVILGSWDFPNGKSSVLGAVSAVRLSRFFSRID